MKINLINRHEKLDEQNKRIRKNELVDCISSETAYKVEEKEFGVKGVQLGEETVLYQVIYQSILKMGNPIFIKRNFIRLRNSKQTRLHGKH